MLSKLATMLGRRRNSFDRSAINYFVDLMAVSNSKFEVHNMSPLAIVGAAEH